MDPQSMHNNNVAENGDNNRNGRHKSPNGTTEGNEEDKQLVIRDQDRFLPATNLGRIMRNSIPKRAMISRDAKVCMQECVSEFISFVTMEASEMCVDSKRKVLKGDDIINAMQRLGFDNYVSPLKLFLRRYRELNVSMHEDDPMNDDDHTDDTQHSQSPDSDHVTN